MSIARIRGLAAYAVMIMLTMAWSLAAGAAEAPINQLSRYFGHHVAIPADVPATSDSISILQLKITAPQNIRSPGIARFVINGQRYLEYHYAGYQEGTHNFLVAVPNSYSGRVTVDAYIDNRLAISNTYSRTRDQLVKNTVILGANDIVLLVDTSGSMSAGVTGGMTRMQLAQKVVNTIGPQLEAEGNNVAVIDYDSSAKVVLGLDTPFRPLSFSATGGTGTSSAIALARQILEGRKSPGKIIISITDGVPNSHSNTEAQIKAVMAKASEGWAIAGIGIGLQVGNYYPIRDSVTDSNASVSLEGAILDMVKTAEEQLRDVNSICAGDKCRTTDNDTEKPKVDVQVVSACRTAIGGDDFRFVIDDIGEAGLVMGSLKVSVDFGDAVLDLPVFIENQAEVQQMQNQGLPPKRVVLRGQNIMSSSALAPYFERANYSIERDGGRKPYTFRVEARDLDGNAKVHTEAFDPVVREDTKAPAISITAGPEGGDGGIMRHVGDAIIHAVDDKSGMDYRHANFTLSYAGKSTDFFISPVEQSAVSANACVARYPLELTYNTESMLASEAELVDMLFSAYETGKPMRLSVEIEDFAKNLGKASRELRFTPEVLITDGVRVPGVKHQFNTLTGRPVVRVTAEEAAFVLGGKVRYYARLLNKTDVPLTVNGIPVNADNAVLLGEFPLSIENSIDLEIASNSDSANARSTLVLVPTSSNARVIQVPIRTWMPDTALTSKDWSPVQLFERALAGVEQRNDAACRLTGVQSLARYADPVNDPVCLVEWTALPTDTYGLEQNKAEATGFIPQPGKHKLGYQIVLFDTDGSRFVVDSGEGEFDVVPAKDVMRFTLGSGLDNTYRVVRQVTGSLKQAEGPNCAAVTIDPDFAMDMSSYNTPGCLITWETLPQGIVQREWTDSPSFGGAFDIYEGDAKFVWKVASYSTSGQKVEIMTEEQVVPLLDPPTPVITMSDEHHVTEQMYWARKEGGPVGDYQIDALNAPLSVDLLENGSVVESDETYAGYTDQLIYRSRILTSEKPLWSRTPFEVRARYSDLPEINAKMDLQVLAVPDENIRPEVQVAETTVLDTDILSVDSWIENPFAAGAPYDAASMGNWEVRLLNYLSFNRQEPVTGYSPLGNDGKTNFQVDLKELNNTFIRIMPEAKLVSPVEEYQRTVMGARPLYITVLRGAPIDATIDARRLMGEAPLNLIAKLDLSNRLDYKALGDVVWEVRKQGESDWKAMENGSSVPDRFQNIFDVGRYEMRAHVFNKNSGAQFTTETIEIHAYNVPVVKIDGPANAFMGSEATLRINAMLGRDKVAPEDMVVQWSEDNGETWVPGGAEYRVRRDEEERVYLMARVRMSESPEDWADSYVERRHRLSFRQVSPPRGSIVGSRVIESGREVEWRGSARPPYTRMDVVIKGRFILPDGTVVDADEVKYLPTEADAQKERVEVSYEAWIEGFEDQGAKAMFTRKISVWQYEWPEWGLAVRASATQAPADIDIRVRKPVGLGRYLEDVQYQWNIPEGVEVVTERTPDSRSLRATKPGTYPIAVEISDARGNYSKIIHEFKVDEPDPWEVDFRMSSSNAENRAPLDLRLFPNVGGGHPRDRISVYRYLLNDKTVSEGVRYASMTLGEGKHDIALEIESEFGQVVRHTKTVEVTPNTPPVCQLSASESRNRWSFVAECEDKTGAVRGHIWTVNGEPVSISGSRISVSSREPMALEVSLKAVDDGGAESAEIFWHGSIGAN